MIRKNSLLGVAGLAIAAAAPALASPLYVPEPTSATLIGASLMIGLLARRRRGGAPIPSKSSSTFVR
jgi:hypothetical protein